MPAENGICGICTAGCAVKVSRNGGGRIETVKPWDSHPGGVCCPRLGRATDIVYAPDRLLYPMKRDRHGELQRVSWDEALDTVADNLRTIAERHGPEAVCLYTGRGVFDRQLCDQLTPAGIPIGSAWNLLFPFGSPNTTGVGAICYVARAVIAPKTTMGMLDADTFADIKQSDLIVVWGANPATDSPPKRLGQMVARRGQARFVVIDHQRTRTVDAVGAEWIGLRPGTDGALALGLIRTVIEEELYDRDFVENWTVGFPELKDYVAAFTPAHVEAITGVPAPKVVDLARAIATAQGATFHSNTGLEYSNSGVQACRAILTLWAITGNLDVPGGKVILPKNAAFVPNQSMCVEPPATSKEPIGKSRYPLYHKWRKECHAMELPRAILEDDPYPIRGLLVFGSSILTGYPDPNLWRRSFEKLDFLMTVDRFLTADSEYADIVLPAATLFEGEGYVIHGRKVQYRKRFIEPLGESKTDLEIALALVDRLGYGHLYPRTPAELIDRALEGTGVTREAMMASPDGLESPLQPPPEMVYKKWEHGLLRQDGRPGFETPTGKFEIASTELAEHGYDALPVYTEPVEGPRSRPDLAGSYPLVFNSGARTPWDFRSQFHNIPSLVARAPEPKVRLHPEDALARGIQSGDTVVLRTSRGEVRYTAEVTENIVRGVVEANSGGGSPGALGAWRDCNVNELTDHENRDPISGFPVYKALLCEVALAVPRNGRSHNGHHNGKAAHQEAPLS